MLENIQIFPSELHSISAFKPYFKDKIFFDIGASVGSWSAFALMYGAKEVYAFDPLPDDRVSPTDNYNHLVTKALSHFRRFTFGKIYSIRIIIRHNNACSRCSANGPSR
jgi:hypothetical protein